MMAFRLSDSIRKDVKNVRAAGDQVELAVRDFFHSKLYPKYHVNDGHIVDKNLKISPQYDLIISDNSKNSTLFSLADKSELYYFEPVFAIGEVKRSFYDQNMINEFSENLRRFKNELNRDDISPNYLEAGNTGVLVGDALTSLPLRNPLLSFFFILDAENMKMKKLKKTLEGTENKYLPNYIVLLNVGMILNVDKFSYGKGEIKINLYPEFEDAEGMWVLLNMPDKNKVLIYQYMLMLEHLNSSVVGTPDVRKYTEKLFHNQFSSFHKI